jgi:pyruvate formate-lyase activating enzyme-like uncharacterized protein
MIKMRILSIQDAYSRKFERQKKIRKLQYHAAGHCVHVGKLSPGCKQCFIPCNSFNILTGSECNLRCPYCPTIKNVHGLSHKKEFRNLKFLLAHQSSLPNFNFQKISFSGGGEPLMYMDVISEYMKLFHGLERHMKKRPWYFVYTNGTLADVDILLQLKELGFDEIRFHLGATNFSKDVYNNLESAVRYFKVITVETPAWPLHRKKLFEMLPIIEDIGVKYLNIGEIDIDKHNYDKISRILPNGEIYQYYTMYLYDNGLVYDIIEEVVRKKYSYSVLDCNSFVKSIQRSSAKNICHQDVKGLCAKY